MKLASRAVSSQHTVVDTTQATKILAVGDVLNGEMGDIATVVVHVGDPTAVTLKMEDGRWKME